MEAAMAINVNNAEADALTRKFARMAGVGITDAIVITMKEAIAHRRRAETPLRTAARLREKHGIVLSDHARQPLPREAFDQTGTKADVRRACAIVAVLSDEPEAGRVSEAIASAQEPMTSPVAVLEAALGLARLRQMSSRADYSRVPADRSRDGAMIRERLKR